MSTQPRILLVLMSTAPLLFISSVLYADEQVSCAARGTPAVDGRAAATWDAAPRIAVAGAVPGIAARTPRQLAWADVRLLWDDKQLYAFFSVRDKHLSAENGAPWEQDSVEALLDENNVKSTAYEHDDVQYRVNFQGRVTGGKNFDPQNITTAISQWDDGYLVEMAVRWRTITPQPGHKIGLELQVNDDAGAGRREGLMKWCNLTDSSWSDTSGHGTVVLRETVSPAELAAAKTVFEQSLQRMRSQQQTLTTAEAKENIAQPPLAVAKAPDWVADAIFYQIFPERFCNGDESNDPTHASLEFPDAIPKSWKISPWTGDWYAREDWEVESGKDFYEHGVFNRRYGGDLQGVMDRLDYIADLGVSAIYFNPVFYARSLHKYDGSSFHHIDPHFGPDPQADLALMQTESSDPATWKWTAADRLFLDLLEKARARGIRVIIDGVFNHSGRDFFAFADLRERQDRSAYTTWYNVQEFDDPATDENEFEYEGWWGVDTLPCFADNEAGSDLHPGPKKYIFDATRRWMDPNGDGDSADGISGWRLDVANELPNQFWIDWHQLVRELNPQAYTTSEIWTDALKYLGETRFTATMNYHGFAYPVKGGLIDGRLPMSKFAEELDRRRLQYPPATQRAMQNLIDSHDTDRVASMIVNARVADAREYLQPERFDYDVGDRVSARNFADYDVSKPNERDRRIQRLVALFQMTYVGAPMIYYGTEAGMWGGDDPDDRMPMIWPDMKFERHSHHPRGRTRKADEVEFDQELYEFYRQAIQLRHDHVALRRGAFKVRDVNDEQQLLVFMRESKHESIMVAINRSDQRRDVYLAGEDKPWPNFKPLLSTSGPPAAIQARYARPKGLAIHLPPLTGIVLAIDP